MTFIDRTDEFVNLVQMLSSGMPNAVAMGGRAEFATRQDASTATQQPHAANPDELNLAATHINNQLAATKVKLKELNQLARQKALFNDRTLQIQELTFDIKQSLTDLNANIESLSEDAELWMQTQSAMRSLNSNDQHYRAHYRNLTETLRNRLLEVTTTFKETLELRTKNMRQQDRRRNLYTSIPLTPTPDHPSSASSSSSSSTNASSSFRLPSSSATKASNSDLESTGGLQTLQFAGPQSLYSQSRAEAMENVQRVIGELGQILSKVAAMVTQQEEMIQRIDDDVDHSLSNVKEGEAYLLKYFRSITSSRTLILKVFAIIILFIVFFVLFLA